jgi:hypothetical protein
MEKFCMEEEEEEAEEEDTARFYTEEDAFKFYTQDTFKTTSRDELIRDRTVKIVQVDSGSGQLCVAQKYLLWKISAHFPGIHKK